MSLELHLLLGLCLLGTALGSNDVRVTYENYRAYRITPSSEAALNVLKKLARTTDSIIFLEGIRPMGHDTEVVVAPHKLPDFVELLRYNNIKNELLERNLQNRFNDDIIPYSSAHSDYGWTSYYQLDDTYDWLRSLQKEYPKIVTVIEGGRTYENRTILGVKISHKSGNKGIFIEAGIHAREWISPATATFIINQLLTSNVTSIMNIAQNYDWYIFPHTNPDGYVYTHTTNRLWRKTRKPYGAHTYGADPNRNWDIDWGVFNSPHFPQMDTYAGPSAFSEIETRTLSNYITSLKEKFQLYISFHSYSQYLMYPNGYTNELPSNVNDLRKVSEAAVAALSKRYGTKYIPGTIAKVMNEKFSGSSVDWVYAKAGIKMAFAYELRPDRYQDPPLGFTLSASEIIPVGEETLDSLSAMVNEVKRLGYFK